MPVVAGITHRGALAHEALAVGAHGHEGHVATAAAKALVNHLAVVDVLDVAAGPHAHAVAVAELVDGTGLQAQAVGHVVGDHLGVVHIATGSQDDTLGGLEQGVHAVIGLGDGAVDALAVLVQLHGGGVVEEGDAVGLELGGNGGGDAGVAAIELLVVGKVEVDGVAVVLDGVVDGRAFDAACGDVVLEGADGLAGVAGPGLDERAVGAVVVGLNHHGDTGLDAGLARLLQVDAGSLHALGNGGTLADEHGHVGASVMSGLGGGKTGVARADDHDIELLRVGEVLDGRRRNEEVRRVVGKVCGVKRGHACDRRALLVGCGFVGESHGAGGSAGDGGEAGGLDDAPAGDGSADACVHVQNPFLMGWLAVIVRTPLDAIRL